MCTPHPSHLNTIPSEKGSRLSTNSSSASPPRVIIWREGERERGRERGGGRGREGEGRERGGEGERGRERGRRGEKRREDRGEERRKGGAERLEEKRLEGGEGGDRDNHYITLPFSFPLAQVPFQLCVYTFPI